MPESWKSILRLEKNAAGRDFVCGDIHGCFGDLEEALEERGFDKARDRLFCVGDLMDRGPASALAAEYMGAPWFFSTLGNHERMFLKASDRGVPRSAQLSSINHHISNGGDWAYGKLPPETKSALLEGVKALPLAIQVGDALIVHAALPEVESLEEIEEDPSEHIEHIVWFRGEYPPVRIPGISRVYVGHSIVEKPRESGKYLNIDTGAFLKHWGRSGKLTILEI
ncbi:MAG: metallophosphoesterase [Treponema sp.]|nr:metallophosphoesterase [Treponema sp.]